MKLSLISFLIFCLLLAAPISAVSLGSSQIFFLPHFNTDAARLWSEMNILSLSYVRGTNGMMISKVTDKKEEQG